MIKTTKNAVLTSIVLMLFFALSYTYSSTYKPKTIKQVQDVKGLQSNNSSLPLPEEAEKIGVNRSNEAEQTTFHTNKSKEEIQDFYKNIFTSNKWELESRNDQTGFIVTRYKRNNETVSVITLDTNDEFKTLVSLEMVGNQ